MLTSFAGIALLAMLQMPETRYADAIARAASRYGVPVAMIKAIIKVESGWDARADSGYSVGLMQVTPSTAGLTKAQLLDPVQNIEAGTKYLSRCFARTHDWSSAVSEYNGGYRPNLGYGSPYIGASPIRVCNAWRKSAPAVGRVLERDCLPGNIVTVRPGAYANQPYIDKVLRWFGEYSQVETPDVPAPAVPPLQASVVPNRAWALVLGIVGTLLGLGRLRGRR